MEEIQDSSYSGCKDGNRLEGCSGNESRASKWLSGVKKKNRFKLVLTFLHDTKKRLLLHDSTKVYQVAAVH